MLLPGETNPHSSHIGTSGSKLTCESGAAMSARLEFDPWLRWNGMQTNATSATTRSVVCDGRMLVSRNDLNSTIFVALHPHHVSSDDLYSAGTESGLGTDAGQFGKPAERSEQSGGHSGAGFGDAYHYSAYESGACSAAEVESPGLA